MIPTSIDVVIPTLRIDETCLEALLQIRPPAGVSVNYFFVLDAPNLPTPELDVNQSGVVTVIRNASNIGAHQSRNRGFEAGAGSHVLFLDDDVAPEAGLLELYTKAIQENPLVPGYVGLTVFPPAANSFTKGVQSSDILTFFDLAKTRDEMAWGVTANLLVRRDAVGDIRFSKDFPKGGGGEDIDFCLRIVQSCGKQFKTVPGAVVRHPWWNGGKRSYQRFARWAYGDSRLPTLFPAHRYYNAPNLVETLFVGSLLGCAAILLGLLSPIRFLAWVALAAASDYAVESIRIVSARRRASPLTTLEATLVRNANDFGRLVGNLQRRHLVGIAERFDYVTTGEWIQGERRIAIIKFILFILSLGVASQV